jgi:hypothetical protein
LPIRGKYLKEMAGTTGLEPATSAVTGQRSNQLNYVPTLFSYLYRKPACLVAFLRFNRFACVAGFNPEKRIPTLMDTMDTKLNRCPKMFCRQTPTQSSCPCPENELYQTEFRSVQAEQLCSESQTANRSINHNER